MATVVSFEHRGTPGRGPLTLVVILDAEDVQGMGAGGPYTVPPEAAADFAGHAIGQLQIVVAFEEHTDAIMKFRESGDRDGLLAYLERGRGNGSAGGMTAERKAELRARLARFHTSGGKDGPTATGRELLDALDAAEAEIASLKQHIALQDTLRKMRRELTAAELDPPADPRPR